MDNAFEVSTIEAKTMVTRSVYKLVVLRTPKYGIFPIGISSKYPDGPTVRKTGLDFAVLAPSLVTSIRSTVTMWQTSLPTLFAECPFGVTPASRASILSSQVI